MIDMYTILITGSRKMTPKMIGAVRKNMNSPQYDAVTMIERQGKIKPILEKINMVGSYYRKTKRETKLKNREEYKNLYSTEIKWLKDNLNLLKDDKFMIDMYTILVTGSRKMTPKMIESVRKNMNSPQYDTVQMIERQEKIKPILEKINMVLTLVKEVDEGKDDYYVKNYSAKPFVTSIMSQLKTRGKLSEKQMTGLNKVYKKYIKMKEKK